MAKSKQAAEVRYPKPEAVIYGVDRDPLDAEEARRLLGWVEEGEPGLYEDDYLCTDAYGKKIRCVLNPHNRPFYITNCYDLKQEILTKHWEFNGEPVIIGENGHIVDGQHTLVALVLAQQELDIDNQAAEKDRSWKSVWRAGEKIGLTKLVVFGVSESDKVVNTVNTCRKRSPMDMLYRTEHFAKLGKADRLKAARAADQAIRLLWHRTGRSLSALNPRRTASEVGDFLVVHKRLVKFIKHAVDESEHIRQIINVGHAAAMMYLMSSSATDEKGVKKYRDTGSERHLDWSAEDKALEFFTLLGSSPDLQAVGEEIGSLTDPDLGLGGIVAERVGVVAKAWKLFVSGEKVTREAVRLDYDTNDDDMLILNECPVVGGIDMGDPEEEVPEDESEAGEGGAGGGEEPVETPPTRRKKSEPGLRLFDVLKNLRDQYPDRILLFKAKGERLALWGKDVMAMKPLGVEGWTDDEPKKEWGGLNRSTFPRSELDTLLTLASAEGYSVSMCVQAEGDTDGTKFDVEHLVEGAKEPSPAAEPVIVGDNPPRKAPKAKKAELRGGTNS